jgi:putative sterol carrier protein
MGPIQKGTSAMAVFNSPEQLYTILQSVFEQLNTTPEKIEPFTRSNLVIRLNLSDPDAKVLLDGRQPPLEVFYGARPGQANLEFSMPADLLHRIWMDEESTSEAFFSGRIKSKGNLLRATHLIELFRHIEEIYPNIAAQHDLL